MTREQPLLTLAIPTCNRSSNLANLLASLQPQLLSEPRVELLVSDNASTDDTAAVITRAIERGLKITRVANAMNIGPDANFLQCYERAAGKYFWLFGDDDFITPGGIARILGLIEAAEYDLIYCAPYVYHEDYLAELKKVRHRRPTEATMDVTRFVRLASYHGDLIFISSIIVNKAKQLTYDHPPLQQMIGTNLAQLGWVFTSLAHYNKGVFLQVGTLAGAARGGAGFNAAKVFGINYANAIDLFIGRHTKLGQLLLNNQLSLWFLANWIGIRQRTGMIDMNASSALLRSRFGRNPRYWLVVLPLAKLPLPLAKLWVWVLLVIRRANRIARNL